ncbi:MAG: FAD-binding oxidoreductase [Candidatus Pacebacteria bacterium]|nr:FAD-binding oxidoreductase [Candidatus Paceibacterota bacterium]
MIHYEEVKKALENILEGEVSQEKKDLENASTDWSLFKIQPDLVVYPKSAKDIQNLVQYVNNYNQNSEQKLTLTPRAAGSDMSGGPLNHSIIVDVTRYMNHIGEIKLGDFGTQEHRAGFPYSIAGKVRVEPGTKYIPFEETTLKKNLLMPTFPASRKLAAVGGMVANNGAGEKSFKYGQNKDFVNMLSVVLADGNEYEIKPWDYAELQSVIAQENFLGKVSSEIFSLVEKNWELIQSKKPQTTKNSSGYLLWNIISAASIEDFKKGIGFFDLTKLFVGAQGTTGIITEIEYKLIPYESKEEMLVIFVNDIYDLPKIVEIFKSHDLDTIELYDDHTFKIGIKFFKDFIKDKGFFDALRYVLRFVPEFWRALTGGIPKFIILGESADKESKQVHLETLKALKDIQTNLPHANAFLATGRSAQKYWDFRHDSFKLLTEHSKKARNAGAGTRTAPFIDDIAIRAEHLPEYLPRLTTILDEYKKDFMYTIAGHLGDGNFHIVPIVDMFDEKNKKRILEISERVYDLVIEYEGTITAEHNDGIIRTPFLPQMFGDDMMAVFKETKKILDPKNIFNPGKKVGMTKDDIEKYLA